MGSGSKTRDNPIKAALIRQREILLARNFIATAAGDTINVLRGSCHTTRTPHSFVRTSFPRIIEKLHLKNRIFSRNFGFSGSTASIDKTGVTYGSPSWPRIIFQDSLSHSSMNNEDFYYTDAIFGRVKAYIETFHLQFVNFLPYISNFFLKLNIDTFQ